MLKTRKLILSSETPGVPVQETDCYNSSHRAPNSKNRSYSSDFKENKLESSSDDSKSTVKLKLSGSASEDSDGSVTLKLSFSNASDESESSIEAPRALKRRLVSSSGSSPVKAPSSTGSTPVKVFKRKRRRRAPIGVGTYCDPDSDVYGSSESDSADSDARPSKRSSVASRRTNRRTKRLRISSSESLSSQATSTNKSPSKHHKSDGSSLNKCHINKPIVCSSVPESSKFGNKEIAVTCHDSVQSRGVCISSSAASTIDPQTTVAGGMVLVPGGRVPPPVLHRTIYTQLQGQFTVQCVFFLIIYFSYLKSQRMCYRQKGVVAAAVVSVAQPCPVLVVNCIK